MGHALVREGDPVSSTNTSGRCQCGALSAPLASNSQRKSWHRQHKTEVLNALELVDTEEISSEAARIWGLNSRRPFCDQNVYIQAPYRAKAMLELLRRIDPDHPAFGDGRNIEGYDHV